VTTNKFDLIWFISPFR